MKILRDDLKKQFDLKNYHEDVKGFLQFNPLSHAWIDRENELIFKIQDLLDKYNPGLFPNWKSEIISSIFTECNLWPNQDRDQAYERMRKRFPAAELKRREEADLQQKVAQDPLCELCGTFKSECKCDLLKI